MRAIEDMIARVAAHFRLSGHELTGKDRHKSVAFARHVAMYLCKQRLGCSFPEIGRAFGNRDHTIAEMRARAFDAAYQRAHGGRAA